MSAKSAFDWVQVPEVSLATKHEFEQGTKACKSTKLGGGYASLPQYHAEKYIQ
jgi:hypothetical protein